MLFFSFFIWFRLLCSLSHLKTVVCFQSPKLTLAISSPGLVFPLLLQHLTTNLLAYNKTHLLFHCSVGQKSQWAHLNSQLRVSQGWNQGTRWAGSFWRFWVKNCRPNSFKLLTEFRCLQLQDRASFSCWLIAGSHLQLLEAVSALPFHHQPAVTSHLVLLMVDLSASHSLNLSDFLLCSQAEKTVFQGLMWLD